MSHKIQRRTAEQIVDLPAPVFTERISARIKGLSAAVEAAETSSQDQNLQRAVEQIIVDCMDVAIFSQNFEENLWTSGVIEAAETSSQDQNLQRTAEQDCVEVDKTTLQERISGRECACQSGLSIEVPKISCQENVEV